jgi:hypothetical protein
MTGRRLRLDDMERAYILRLIRENNKMHQELTSKPIVKLIKKLEDTVTDVQLQAQGEKKG